MPQLNASAAATVRQFAQQMDVEPFEAPDGSFSFDFERSGRFSIIAAPDGTVVLTLTGKIIIEDLMGYAGHVGRGGWDPRRGTLLHCGLTKAGQPVLAVRSSARRFDLPTLQQTLEAMVGQMGGR